MNATTRPPNVLGSRYDLKVVVADAIGHETQMIKRHLVGDRAASLRVAPAMGGNILAVEPELAVPANLCAYPEPAIADIGMSGRDEISLDYVAPESLVSGGRLDEGRAVTLYSCPVLRAPALAACRLVALRSGAWFRRFLARTPDGSIQSNAALPALVVPAAPTTYRNWLAASINLARRVRWIGVNGSKALRGILGLHRDLPPGAMQPDAPRVAAAFILPH